VKLLGFVLVYFIGAVLGSAALVELKASESCAYVFGVFWMLVLIIAWDARK